MQRGALKQDGGGSIDERSVNDVAVASDPADVGHAAKNIARTVVEDNLEKGNFFIKRLPGEPLNLAHEHKKGVRSVNTQNWGFALAAFFSWGLHKPGLLATIVANKRKV